MIPVGGLLYSSKVVIGAVIESTLLVMFLSRKESVVGILAGRFIQGGGKTEVE